MYTRNYKSGRRINETIVYQQRGRERSGFLPIPPRELWDEKKLGKKENEDTR